MDDQTINTIINELRRSQEHYYHKYRDETLHLYFKAVNLEMEFDQLRLEINRFQQNQQQRSVYDTMYARQRNVADLLQHRHECAKAGISQTLIDLHLRLPPPELTEDKELYDAVTNPPQV